MGFLRVNLLSTAPEDIANTLNCIHSILQRHQMESERAEVSAMDARRLRNDLQVADQAQSRLKRDLELKERDVGGLLIKVRGPYYVAQTNCFCPLPSQFLVT